MKHAVKGKQLNRDIGSRRSLFKNLTLALIEHGHITTTHAKAQAIRSSFDKLITKAKQGTLHSRRLIDKELNQRKAVNRLVDEIGPNIKRTSGFTRLIKLGMRRGDAAEMVKMEIIDWQPKLAAKATTKKEKAVKEVVATKKSTSGASRRKVRFKN
jgi:large subunit ribosomal protein L17